MKILVTGANGHIGAHVVRQLLDEGHAVRAFVRPRADVRALEGLDLEYARGDVMDAEAVHQAAEGCDAIIHLAAVYKTIAETAEEIVEPAVRGAENVFRAAHAHGIGRVVYTSSVASIGFSWSPDELRTADDWNTDAKNPYYLAKTLSEQKAQALAQELGIHLVVICPAIVIGPLDYRITPSNQLVKDWLNGKGQTYPGGLNLVDVEDVARAHVNALTRGESGRRYIVGSDNLPVKEIGRILERLTGIRPLHLPFGRSTMLFTARVTETLCRIIGMTPPFTYDLVYEVAGRYAYYDISETCKVLEIRPRPSEQALARAVRWLAEQGHLKPSVARRVSEMLASTPHLST
ncbi:NAD-dependent epimerase/dehydratase family protein [Hahella sp. SMD15-11]|uniref:NAD-dependent epimerase/dehydratase family protein n=1 Tax=Thermohahella caldifontis TaxID=3142973 RepID=A0AB39UZ84_9GAMM